MSAAYMEGAHSTPGFACTAKLFPGNGLEAVMGGHIMLPEYAKLINLDEGFSVMLEAYKNGTIREERMIEALTWIHGLKAHLGLNKRKTEELKSPGQDEKADGIGRKTESEFIFCGKECSKGYGLSHHPL